MDRVAGRDRVPLNRQAVTRSGEVLPGLGPVAPADLPALACRHAAPAARDGLAWMATRTVDQMCADAWRWQSQNPTGYPDS